METLLLKRGFWSNLILFMSLLFSTLIFGQTVTLDQADLDYAPGETVYITGTGWQPNEVINLRIDHLTEPIPDHGTPDPHLPWTVVADGSGNFEASWFVTEPELNSDLLLVADGSESGFTYEVFFTDSVTVTAATGGNSILADKAANSTSPAYTTLENIVIVEGNNGDFNDSVTQLVLNAPNGWSFKTSGVNATVSGSNGVDFAINGSITYTSSTITIPISVSANNKKSTLTISGVAVMANDGAAITGSTVNITPTFTGNIANLTTSTNLGSLSQVVGAPNKLVVTLPGQNFTDGPILGTSGNSGTVTAQTAGTAFNIAKLTTTDQFFNIISSYSGPKTISYTGPGTGYGVPTYTTSVNFTNGQSITSLATTLKKAETTTITCSDTTITGPASSSLVVNKANTTTIVASNLNPSTYGQSVTFTATVSGVGTATGTVDFKDGSTTIGSATLNGSGVATFSTSLLSATTHTITAVFLGDGNFNTSTSLVLNQTVGKRAITVTADAK
ncbi:Ig-like domain-containing protein, partial [Flavobacterium limnosediminis]|uniref:Ig-like domain-containing protein n=1 Tax=Flavobacterium limnosediminis TaxID=1401027 RepID=UPI001B7FB360